jgi:Protein of unknown function (DUF4058)
VPLRDHFRPPVSKRSSWQGFHGGWPMVMVQQLAGVLPQGFTAEPRAQLGTYYEIDIGAFDEDRDVEPNVSSQRKSNGEVATATWAPPEPTLIIDAEIPEQYEYEVLVYDLERDRTLVAAVEIVSLANKDRPDNRQLFVAKCTNLLTKGVCVSIVDLVTIRHFNLYADLLALIGRSDPSLGATPPATYATTCRRRKAGRRTKLELWSYPLVVGQPLPRLPIWLTETHAVSLDLDASYEETCRALRIV